jgi:hypothetical protein
VGAVLEMFTQNNKFPILLEIFLKNSFSKSHESSYFYQKVLKPTLTISSLLKFFILFLLIVHVIVFSQENTSNISYLINDTYALVNQTPRLDLINQNVSEDQTLVFKSNTTQYLNQTQNFTTTIPATTSTSSTTVTQTTVTTQESTTTVFTTSTIETTVHTTSTMES